MAPVATRPAGTAGQLGQTPRAATLAPPARPAMGDAECARAGPVPVRTFHPRYHTGRHPCPASTAGRRADAARRQGGSASVPSVRGITSAVPACRRQYPAGRRADAVRGQGPSASVYSIRGITSTVPAAAAVPSPREGQTPCAGRAHPRPSIPSAVLRRTLPGDARTDQHRGAFSCVKGTVVSGAGANRRDQAPRRPAICNLTSEI